MIRSIVLLTLLIWAAACGNGGHGNSFRAENEVGKVCGGIQAVVCSEGLYCQFPANTCGAHDTTGLCQLQPQLCTADVNPVCGCDGKVYSNDCEATRSGQSIRPIEDCNGN